MIQKLVILGLLKKNPSSGYDIKKFISNELGMFSELNNQSIYYPLKMMAAEGLIKKIQHKGEKNLKKYIYSITPKGELAFLDLCKKVILSQKRPFMELDIALYFLPFLNAKKILPFLRLRLMFLDNVRKWLIKKEREFKGCPNNIALLIKHNSKLAAAEKDFLKDMIDAIKAGKI